MVNERKLSILFLQKMMIKIVVLHQTFKICSGNVLFFEIDTFCSFKKLCPLCVFPQSNMFMLGNETEYVRMYLPAVLCIH